MYKVFYKESYRTAWNNKFFSKHKNKRSITPTESIEVFVENELDKFFWKDIFDKFTDYKIVPKVNQGSARGKDILLKNYLLELGKKKILCIDSDLNFIVEGHDECSANIRNNISVFHTYAYSIENYKCFGNSLNKLCKKISLNYDSYFCFNSFLSKLSKILYEYFLLLVYSEINNSKLITMKELEEVFKEKKQKLKGRIDESIINNYLNDIQNALLNCIFQDDNKIYEYDKINNDDLTNLEKNLYDRVGLTCKNTYLFIKGHILLDDIISPLFQTIVSSYRTEYINKLKGKTQNQQQLENILKQVDKLYKDTYSTKKSIDNNQDFYDCYLIENIKKDIDLFTKYHYHTI